MPKSQITKLTLKHLLKIEQSHLRSILIILVQITHITTPKYDKYNKYIYCVLLKIVVKCLTMINFYDVIFVKFEAAMKHICCIFRHFICLRILQDIPSKIMAI